MTVGRIKRIKTPCKTTEEKIAVHQPYFTVHQLILKIKLIVLWVTLGFRNKHQNSSTKLLKMNAFLDIYQLTH